MLKFWKRNCLRLSLLAISCGSHPLGAKQGVPTCKRQKRWVRIWEGPTCSKMFEAWRQALNMKSISMAQTTYLALQTCLFCSDFTAEPWKNIDSSYNQWRSGPCHPVYHPSSKGYVSKWHGFFLWFTISGLTMCWPVTKTWTETEFGFQTLLKALLWGGSVLVPPPFLQQSLESSEMTLERWRNSFVLADEFRKWL